MKKTRIGIIGSGALGALYGARLHRAGYNVHFLLRSDYDAVREHGLRINSWQGNFTIQPPIYRSAKELGSCDLLIVGLKATQNDLFPELLAPTTHEETAVLTLQNGLGNEEAILEALAAKFGHAEASMERILGGVAFLCSTRPQPGVVDHTDHGRLAIAEFSGPATDRTRSIAAAFQEADFPCTVSDSLLKIRWEKLVWNVPFNGLGVAAHHADADIVMKDDPLFESAVTLMKEVIAAARADGVQIEPGFVGKMIEATRPIGAYKSSMQLDWEADRPLEVEAILGEPLKRAQKAAIPTPAMQLLYGIVKRLNASR